MNANMSGTFWNNITEFSKMN